MTRKAKSGLFFLALAIAAPPAIWFVSRPRMPIEFLGSKPDAKFLFREEFEGKPWINWKAPGGTMITYPQKKVLAGGKPDPALAGYLQYPPSTSGTYPLGVTDFLEVGGERLYLPVAFIPDPSTPKTSPAMSIRGGSISSIRTIVYFRGIAGASNDIVLRGIPFATEEAYRDAVLTHDNQRYPVRLAVSEAFGPAIRRTETFKVGKWTVTAKPRPWKLTTQDMRFDLTTDAPPGVKLIFRPKWKPVATSPPFMYSVQNPYVIEGGRETTLIIPRWQATAKFGGDIVELESVPITLRCERGETIHKKKEFRLFFKNGDLAYFQNSGQKMEKNGFLMMDVRGRRIIANGYGNATDGKPMDFSRIKDNEEVEAVGYRAKTKTAIQGEFDVPAPYVEQHQFVYGTGTTRSYVYISPGP